MAATTKMADDKSQLISADIGIKTPKEKSQKYPKIGPLCITPTVRHFAKTERHFTYFRHLGLLLRKLSKGC